MDFKIVSTRRDDVSQIYFKKVIDKFNYLISDFEDLVD